ncbi:MAG: hypothetical protein AB7G93_02205 [Bdellovibrionales bacterium]
MKRLGIRWIVLCAVLVLIGCEKEDPTPHLRDPIYKNLAERHAQHAKAYEESVEKLKSLREALAKTEPHTIEVKDLRRDIQRLEKQVVQDRQWARYYDIRSRRRIVVDRITYRKALESGKPWPDPSEYSGYLVNRRLIEINRNWNARVPKLQDRLTTATKVPAKAGETSSSPDKEGE